MIMCLATVLTAGNICLSIQSLVLEFKRRCHFFVAHSAYSTFTGVSTVLKMMRAG
jgi:hypothetical protein